MSGIWSVYSGKKCVVTGAASGMGAEVARLLKEGGAEVIALDRQPISLSGVTALTCDLLDKTSIDRAIDGIRGNVDAVFGCAGLSPKFPDAQVMTVNFFANRYFTERCLPLMVRGGAIATIASLPMGWTQRIEQIRPCLDASTWEAGQSWCADNAELLSQAGAYLFAKHCLIAYTTAKASEYIQKHGIRLNTLCPGKTDTPMMDEFKSTVGAQLDATPVPIGHNSKPVQQAHAMLFLNCSLADYIVGIALSCDGGMLASLTNEFLIKAPKPAA